jgi:hypothetical protein
VTHPHASFINDLGGATALAKHFGLKSNVAGNWLKQGIPWKYRPLVADLAKRQRKKLPENFLNALADEAA